MLIANAPEEESMASVLLLWWDKTLPIEKAAVFRPKLYTAALQRHNTENSKQIFPEMELRGLSANFHIHVSVSDLYILTIGLLILLQENIWNYPGNIQIARGNWDWGCAIPYLGIHKWDFRCSEGGMTATCKTLSTVPSPATMDTNIYLHVDLPILTPTPNTYSPLFNVRQLLTQSLTLVTVLMAFCCTFLNVR
jgi:hypothetical protein